VELYEVLNPLLVPVLFAIVALGIVTVILTAWVCGVNRRYVSSTIIGETMRDSNDDLWTVTELTSETVPVTAAVTLVFGCTPDQVDTDPRFPGVWFLPQGVEVDQIEVPVLEDQEDEETEE